MTAEALRVLEGGRAPRGWEELWARDQWHPRELPHGDLASVPGGGGILHFEGLVQPWLREAAKRWARARLLRSTTPQTMSDYLSHLQAFSGWLAEREPGAGSPAAITRAVLEDYMLRVRSRDLAPGTKSMRVSRLRMFLEEQREDGLAGLPPGAVIHAGEIPLAGYRLRRRLERRIFDQFVDPGNLALLPLEQHRTVVLLLAYTGLRVSSVVTLARDALEIGSDGHPYLRYRNVKLRREAVIPIGPVLTEQLRRQEDYLEATHGSGTGFLLPSPPAGRRGTSGGGGHHLSHTMIRQIVKRYVRKAEIRDGEGRLATWVHPHLFRHHLGTSMVNDGVPLPVIQRVLDHASPEMTARYAELHDETLRREIARWHERVNIRGERVALPVEGPLGQAAWDEGAHRPRPPGAPERLLRPAAGPDLPAPQRLPQLRQLPHRPVVPAGPRATAREDRGAARARRAAGQPAAGRGARARRAVPEPDPHRTRGDRSRPPGRRDRARRRRARRPPARNRERRGVSVEDGNGLRPRRRRARRAPQNAPAGHSSSSTSGARRSASPPSPPART
jgi:integrase